MDIQLDGLSAKNPGYLLSLVRILEQNQTAHPVEDLVLFKKSNSRRVVVLLPGSYLNVRYLSDLAAGLIVLDADVIGINYPGHYVDTQIKNLDSLCLADYVAAVYSYLLSIKPNYDEIYLIGHSLGTILVQLSIFLNYAYSSSGKSALAVPIRKIAILGGGPPKIGVLDYVTTLLFRWHTMATVMQMAKNPSYFISEQGDMKKSIGNDALYEDLKRQNLIFAESKMVMKEAFFDTDYSFIPARIVKYINSKALFAYATNDYFVNGYSTQKAVKQWAATPLRLSVGHSGMVLGDAGRNLGVACAEFFA